MGLEVILALPIVIGYCQAKGVNGRDTVFVGCVCVCLCVCVHSGLVDQTSLEQLKLQTSNLTCLFPGTVWTWPLKNFWKRGHL